MEQHYELDFQNSSTRKLDEKFSIINGNVNFFCFFSHIANQEFFGFAASIRDWNLTKNVEHTSISSICSQKKLPINLGLFFFLGYVQKSKLRSWVAKKDFELILEFTHKFRSTFFREKEQIEKSLDCNWSLVCDEALFLHWTCEVFLQFGVLHAGVSVL